MVNIFWLYLLLGVGVILISVWIALSAISYELERHGIRPGEGGHLYQNDEGDGNEDEIPNSFSYCFKPAICEAFQVTSKLLPAWVIADNIDVQILPEPRIIIHQEGEEDMIASASDYVARNELGKIWVISEADMKDGFAKIELIQESI